jgi:hypothetical protein
MPRGYSDEENRRIRALAKEVVTNDFAGHVTNAAAALGLNQGTLSAFLSPQNPSGAGPKIVGALAALRGITIDEVVNGRRGGSPVAAVTAARLDFDPHPVRRQVIAALRDNGWPESILLELRNTELSDGDNPDAWFAEAERLKQFWGRAPKYNAEPMADDGPPGARLAAVPPRKRRR